MTLQTDPPSPTAFCEFCGDITPASQLICSWGALICRACLYETVHTPDSEEPTP